MDENMEFPVIDGIDWDYGRLHFGGMDDLLLETTEEYYMTLPASMEKIQNSFAVVETPDGLNNYRIETHSVKSTSALIGAIHLHGLAKTAEYAAKDSDLDTIRAITPILLREMKNIQEKLSEMFAKEDSGDKIPVDPAKVVALISIIRYAMGRMDVDTVDERVNQLNEFAFDPDAAALIQQLQVSTMNLDVAKTNDILDDLEAKFDN